MRIPTDPFDQGQFRPCRLQDRLKQNWPNAADGGGLLRAIEVQEARCAWQPFCRPLAGTGLPARYNEATALRRWSGSLRGRREASGTFSRCQRQASKAVPDLDHLQGASQQPDQDRAGGAERIWDLSLV
jgi:hypothetical protein